MSRLDDIALDTRFCDGFADVEAEDFIYLLAVARAAERCVKDWDTLNAGGSDPLDLMVNEAALRAALEAK